MGLQNLLNRLKNEASDTPDTSETSPGYQPKPSIHAGCTRDTPDTPQRDCLRNSAANDATPPWRVSIAPGTPPDALERMRAASLALDKAQSTLRATDPNRWFWPHADAELPHPRADKK